MSSGAILLWRPASGQVEVARRQAEQRCLHLVGAIVQRLAQQAFNLQISGSIPGGAAKAVSHLSFSPRMVVLVPFSDPCGSVILLSGWMLTNERHRNLGRPRAQL